MAPDTVAEAVADAVRDLSTTETPDEAAAIAAASLRELLLDGGGGIRVVLYERAPSDDGLSLLGEASSGFDDGETIARESHTPPAAETADVRRVEDEAGISLVVAVDGVGLVEVAAEDRPAESRDDAVEAIAAAAFVTARSRRRVADLRERLADLRRENEQLTEFAEIVSHDLRNPLSVAGGHLELAAETGEDEHFERIREAHDRIESIVEHTLSLARTDETTDVERVDLASVAERSWESVDTGDADLVVASTCQFGADPARLRQLFENLYRNAIEHGGPDVTVRVGAIDDGFFVEDDGPGVPEEERESVFERGYSTGEEGTGLGLSIVQEIVDAHGWSVDIVDGTQGGARFEFSEVR